MKPVINQVQFTFSIGTKVLIVKWLLLGTKTLSNAMNYKEWRVTIIDPWDGSGVANKIIGDTYLTTLQPNQTNSNHFLIKITNG
jgi:hypothetical protein